MAKAKKVEKRSTPKKAARKVVKSEGRLAVAERELTKLFTKPTAKVVKLVTKGPKLVKAAYPEREPDDPLGMRQALRSVQQSKPDDDEAPKIEVTVRNIYHDNQYLPSLCFRKPGAMHVPCVTGDPINGIRKFTVQAAQHDKSTVLQHGYGAFAAPYTPERFAEHMRKLASTTTITAEARALLLPYASDMPTGPATASPGLSDAHGFEPALAAQRAATVRKAPGTGRTAGKDLIRTLSTVSKLPPEKVRAKLRAAGMRAPYTDEAACRKALGVNV